MITAAPAYVQEMPLAEAVGGAKAALVFHPRTLERFECADLDEFKELWGDLHARLNAHIDGSAFGWSYPSWFIEHMDRKRFVPFEAVKRTFVMKNEVVPDSVLAPELRRVWTALRWALVNYAAVVANEGNVGRYRKGNGRVYDAAHTFQILVGRSTSAQAWTDGESYIAINLLEIEKIPKEGLRAAQRIFALVDHELAHQGDSLDATHDEAFYNRFHDITLTYAHEKQTYLHQLLAKYTLSGGRSKRYGWAKRQLTLTERAAKGEGEGSSYQTVVPEGDVPAPFSALLLLINAGLGADARGPILDRETLIEAERAVCEEVQARCNEQHENVGSETEDNSDREIDEDWAAIEADYQETCRREKEEVQEEARERAAFARPTLTQALGREPTDEEMARAANEEEGLAFANRHHRMPFFERDGRDKEIYETEVRVWCRLKRPTLRPEHNLVVLERLARQSGQDILEYWAGL